MSWPSMWKGTVRLTLPRFFGERRRKRCSHEFLALLSQLREAELNLDQASTGLERQFLATSTELETLAQLGGQFVKQVETLISLATGNECDSSALANAIGLIEQSTRFLTGCQEQTTRTLDLLKTYNIQIEDLLGVESELQRTMLPLKFVQTLFKEESAPLGRGIQEMFGALTQEIEELHTQVRDIFGTKFKQLEQTHQTIGKVIVRMDRQTRSLQQATQTHKARIESSIETLKKEITSNQNRDVRLGRVSKELAGDVDQVVMGLQFQDIINQKLQHVRAALPQIETKFTEFSADSNPNTASTPLQFLHQSCRLEAEQLEAAREELAKAEASIHGGVQKVLGRLSEMDSQCLSLEEFKLLTTSFDGMVQALLEMIEEVRDLVSAMVASATEAYEMLRPLGSLASDLTEVVREMSARIHLIGLNAQLQAARAAQDRRGAGLEVLSARTSEISHETNRISQQAANQLDGLAAGLAETVRALGQLRTEALAHQALMTEEGLKDKQALHAFRDSALETLRAIGTSLDDIKAQAQRTQETIQLTPFHQVTLPALRTPLVAIGDMAEAWLTNHGSGIVVASLIEGFKRDYTMASERQVFDNVTSTQRLSGPPLPPEETQRRADIELFTDSPAGAEENPAPRQEDALEIATLTTTAAPPAADGGDLGANAELF